MPFAVPVAFQSLEMSARPRGEGDHARENLVALDEPVTQRNAFKKC
jgi:hypothetical protein